MKVPAGVYGIWSPDRKLVYVGSSSNLTQRRRNYKVLLGFGATFEVVLNLTGAAVQERYFWEDRLTLALRDRGVEVINQTNAEIASMRGAKGNAARTLEFQREQGRRLQASITVEDRMEAGRKSQEKRKQRGQAALLGRWGR